METTKQDGLATAASGLCTRPISQSVRMFGLANNRRRRGARSNYAAPAPTSSAAANGPVDAPWVEEVNTPDGVVYYVRHIAHEVSTMRLGLGGKARETANLIAAGPGLLAAAKMLARIHDELSQEVDDGIVSSAFERWEAGVEALRAAIAKAERGQL